MVKDINEAYRMMITMMMMMMKKMKLIITWPILKLQPPDFSNGRGYCTSVLVLF